MRILKLTLLIGIVVLFISFLPNQSHAQHNEIRTQSTYAWINLGYGVMGSDQFSGLGLLVNTQYDSPIGLLGLRYFIAGDTSYKVGFSTYIDEISEAGLTYGYKYDLGMLNFSASAGAGILWGEEKSTGSGNPESFNVLTIPVQGSITFRPAPIIGVGAMISSSINSKSTIGGALFVLQLGRFR